MLPQSSARPPVALNLAPRPTDSAEEPIFGDARELKNVLPPEGLVIDTYPYLIGRHPQRGDSASQLDVDLMLEDSTPYRMSRMHFAILRTQDGFQVRDLESTLGTSVNGMFLGKHFGSDRASLKRGENFIAAGGVDSQFRFRVLC